MFCAIERTLGRWRQRLKNRKGQSLIEFAMVFPFFLLALYGILYFGFLFADYVTLNDIARSTARTAALSTESGTVIKQKQLEKTGRMPSEALGDPIFLFTKNGVEYDPNNYQIAYETDAATGIHNVTVTIKAKLNTGAFLARMFETFYNFRWNDGSGKTDAGNSLPFSDGLAITYTMYDEIQNR
ncbi:TadE/TadG family type IV pilus assembly protein [Selenomonas sp.]|uniref:TadE/TadG family type IV pilus assembly protein n=1 Tax=Selenomonas sp. TaxID=2053611 RepID=UPI0025F0FC0B|nr:TadE/TadG family type IV pilus assembly protein [Selenomonas sp.]MCI6283562.1 pilus assembly protein [Selenomonas sp.]